MPELPDICVLARSMDQALRGRVLAAVAVHQPKCLNCTPAALAQAVVGRSIVRARQRGKWALLDLDSQWTIALNLGMGGEMRLQEPERIADPRRERVVFRFRDGHQLWAHFWWFGHVHLVPLDDWKGHPQLSSLGPEPLADDFTPAHLTALLQRRRGAIKRCLLDQRIIAGIGNVYVQDILWYARLHPLRPAASLTAEETARLHGAIRHVLQEGIRWGGGPREYDVWGNEGQYSAHLQVGYRTGQPCPACATPIEELRVGATMSYICPRCQPLERP